MTLIRTEPLDAPFITTQCRRGTLAATASTPCAVGPGG